MTPAKKKAPATPASGKPRTVPIATIAPNPDNPRPRITKESVAGLAESISGVGLLQPLVVTPDPKNSDAYHLQAGHRRLAAVMLLGWAEVPVIVRGNGRDTAYVTLAENLQRAGADPLKEAAIVASLLAEDGATLRSVAHRIGFNERWVAQRAAFAAIDPAVARAITESKIAGERRVEWLDVVAMLAPPSQRALVGLGEEGKPDAAEVEYAAERLDEMAWEYPDPDSFRTYVASKCATLAHVPWTLDDADLVKTAGACSACPDNSAVGTLSGALFAATPGDKKRKGKGADTIGATCRNPTCWTSKFAAWLDGKVDEARKAHGDALRYARGEWDATLSQLLPDLPEGTKLVESHQAEKAKARTKGAFPAIVVTGKGLGSVRWLRPKRSATRDAFAGDAKGAAPKGGSKAAENGVDPETAAAIRDKEVRLAKKRVRAAIERVVAAVEPCEAGTALGAGAEGDARLLQIVLAYGTRAMGLGWLGTVGDGHDALDGTRTSFLAATAKVRRDVLWGLVRENILETLREAHRVAGEAALDEAACAAWAVGLDFDAIAATVEEEVPEPRALAKLRAAATETAGAGA
jgi:ParB/RepB/Spo0J family partition protein